jgi:SAM-dependent methyltransferase
MQRYQDALGADGTESGERDCRPRWDLIAAHVPTSGLILDIGSNLGYYGLKAVGASPDVAVVSIEADPEIAERQANLLRAHDTSRICLVQGAVNARVASAWADTCDWFDLTLMLSVLHWLDDPASVIRDVSRMSAVMIVEVPDVADTGACGQDRLALWADPERWFAAQTGRRVTTLGRMERHTSEVPSHLLMIDGPVRRVASRPYWAADYERPDQGSYVLDFDGQRLGLTIRGRIIDYVPGINLVNLMRLGRLVHPAQPYWLDQARAAIEAEPSHGDPFPHNMLWGPHGITLIDGDDLQVETPHASGWRSVQRNVEAWARNRTTSEFAYVRDRLGPWRTVRGLTGRFLRTVLGDARVDRLKARIGMGPISR